VYRPRHPERTVLYRVGFCPSCYAKRIEEWGEWVRERLLARSQTVLDASKPLFYTPSRRMDGTSKATKGFVCGSAEKQFPKIRPRIQMRNGRWIATFRTRPSKYINKGFILGIYQHHQDKIACKI